MADVTINALTTQVPGTNDVFPFSTAVSPSTYKASLAQIKTGLGLAAVASTGSYTDLINTPTIPSATTIAKAWVRFDGTGTSGTNQTIRSQYNVSSVNKLGTGKYRVYFTSALSNTSYTVASNGIMFPYGSIPNGNITNGDQQGVTVSLNYNTAYFDVYTSTPWIPYKDFAYYYDSLNVHVVVFGL